MPPGMSADGRNLCEGQGTILNKFPTCSESGDSLELVADSLLDDLQGICPFSIG